MERAVDAFKDAVTTCPDIMMKCRNYSAHIFNNLAVATILYFDQSGRITVIDELLSIVAKLLPQNVLESPFFATNLAEAMLMRADVADIDSARALVHQTIRICQNRKISPSFIPDHDGQISREHIEVNLQLIRASRMQIRTGEHPYLSPKDILQLAQHSFLSLPPQETNSRLGLVLAQTDAWVLMSRIDDDVSHLEAGLALVERELRSSEMSSSIYVADLVAARADLLFAQASQARLEDKKNILDSAWDQYERAANSTSGRARERFQVCLRWAGHALGQEDATEAFKAYSYAIDILPQVVFLGEEVIGRIEALRQVNGLAASSVATALTVGNVSQAIEYLEQTRGILWLQSSRGTDSELTSIPEALRDRLVDVRVELENSDRLHWTTRRHKAEELSNVLSEIRQLPELSRFQLPPLMQDIQLALQERKASAVIIIPSTSYCDVIVLGMNSNRKPSDSIHLRLPQINIERIRVLAQRFSEASSVINTAPGSYDAPRKMWKAVMPEELQFDASVPVLFELWTNLVYPVLQHMDIHVSDSSKHAKTIT
jgi:hypothetical protein